MKQKPIQSQTTQILFQEPTEEEMYGKPRSIFADLCTFLLLLSLLIGLVAMLRSCADDTETQAVQAHTYNAKFSKTDSALVQVVETR
ncbi:hypothetical protein F939_02309 [Acinetobacter radioresistens DSM 6976 = NBRC 102413 = CIP 103788]|uniref:hypothetical protein n=2 Tax=Acinetobacter radioresistens TaxID=40216 RepID=UPI00028F054D|nr:hypothetical protein [Acinetobacter radioresistens]ENV87525.1 hypothetical protein F939_02309 [Acinetobacter radioresistens DSM 6976 = NBRC 102413 = CIP 103788]BBL21157.1 hypothetical protein ACRAD_18280 [Acinetobacter radioresistens DSM 6976 = NBRC 102413 = CIP 103788]